MYHQFNIQQLYVLPTQCIFVFCVDLRTNSDFFPKNINWLVFITETYCVYCAVRTGSLNVMPINLSIQSSILTLIILVQQCAMSVVFTCTLSASFWHILRKFSEEIMNSCHTKSQTQISCYKIRLVRHQSIVMLQFCDRLQQFRQFLRNVTLRRVQETIVSVKNITHSKRVCL